MTDLISIVTPIYNIPPEFLVRAFDSLKSQTYTNWEWCICDDCSTNAETIKVIQSIATDKRVRYTHHDVNGGIGKATQSAAKLVSGKYIAFFDSDDLLTPCALQESHDNLIAGNYDLVYSDEDLVDTDDKLIGLPHYKPDFSPHYLLCSNYICHFVVIKTELYNKIGGVLPGYDGSQDHEFLLRVTSATDRIYHIKSVLYHWRQFNTFTRTEATQIKASQAGIRAVTEHLDRKGCTNHTVYTCPDIRFPNGRLMYYFKKDLTHGPKVTIVIPTKLSSDKLVQNLTAISQSTYTNYEIVLVCNSKTQFDKIIHKVPANVISKLKTIEYAPALFNFAKALNTGCLAASGDYIVVMHDGITIKSTDWLEQMLSYATEDNVGIVSCKILDNKTNSIIYAGAYTDGDKITSSFFAGQSEMNSFWNRNIAVQNVSVAYSMLMMFSKNTFSVLKGFDEEFSVYHTDVDFCLRSRYAGALNVYIPVCTATYQRSGTRITNCDSATYNKLCAKDNLRMQENHKHTLSTIDPFAHPKLFQVSNVMCTAGGTSTITQSALTTGKLVSYILPWYNNVPTALLSLLTQQSAEIECIVVHDGPIPTRVHNIINALEDSRIKLVNTEKISKNWGHTPRNFGIDHISPESAFIIFGGIDNYYFPTFTKEMVAQFSSNHICAAYSNFYYNGINWGGQYAQLALGKIDCGCFMVRSHIAKQLRWLDTHYEADWAFINKVVQAYGKQAIAKLERTLFVHN